MHCLINNRIFQKLIKLREKLLSQELLLIMRDRFLWESQCKILWLGKLMVNASL